jgi:hypothetical protein
VLERHFAEFSPASGLHASISRKKVFPKGIPVNATPKARMKEDRRGEPEAAEKDEKGLSGR